jgi:outer membrane protein TolC
MRVKLSSAARALGALAVLLGLAVPAAAQIQTPPAPPPVDQASGPVRQLTIDEAVALGLENNLNLRVERINPQLQDANIAQARSAFSPNLFGQFNYNNADTPPASLLTGTREILQSDRYYGNMGVSQQLPWWGANYQVTWDGQRSTSNSVYNNFNPSLGSSLQLLFTQPLLRNFSVDAARQQLLVSRANREISDIDLRNSVVSTVRNVRAAFWNLAYAVANLKAQQQSLDLSRQMLKDNRTRVDVGTMAPIDIVEAEAEVARNEETVIVAESNIRQAEDLLRVQIFSEAQPDFWRTRIEPIYDQALLAAAQVDAEAAVQNALAKRADLQSAKKQIETTNLNIRYYRNQLLPQVDLQASFLGDAIGGQELIREPGFPPGPVTGEVYYPFGSVVGDALTYEYPTWQFGVQVSYPLGTSAAKANVTRARLQLEQSRLQIQNLELQIATEVRDAARQVNTNTKRIQATRAARVLAERRLEAEQKKFGVGMSTSFLVFQAQRDLTTARNNELQALVDYAKSRVDFEAVQEGTISGTGITLPGAGNVLATGVGSQTASAATQSSTQRR